MSPTLSFEHVDSKVLDPFAWFNIIGELGCVFWIAAYVFIIRQGVYQLVRYGRRLQTIPEVRNHFHAIIVITTVLSCLGLYTFYLQYYDLLGLVGAFMINLVMSVAFVFFFFFSRRLQGGLGLSVPAAACKLLGTLGTSIECHFVIGMSQPWLGGLSFLTFLCVCIFLFDCLYLYLVMGARAEAFYGAHRQRL